MTQSSPLVLVATTDSSVAARLRDELQALHCEVVVVSSVINAIAELHGIEFDMVIVAISLPPRGGLDIVRVARELSPEAQVVVLLDPGQQNAPVDCIRNGAFDFLHQPVCATELREVIDRATTHRQLRTTTAMFQASHAILTGTDREQLPGLIVSLAAQLLSADAVSLYQRDRAGRLYVAHSVALSKRDSDADDLLAIASSITGRPDGGPILLPEDTSEQVFVAGRIRSVILCPIIVEGAFSAVLAAARSMDPRPFRRSDADRAGVFASQLRLVLENAQLLEKTVATERLAAIGELAAGIAHEINNPLTYVLYNCANALEELDEVGPKSEDLRSMLEDVQDGAERIRTIAQDLRTLSRTTDPAEVFDAGDAIRAALRVTGPMLRASLEVETDLESEMLVLASRGRMCQVFVNLLANAAQAAASCPGRVGLRVDASRQGEHVVVTVRDTGPGIAPAHLPRVFDAFFTTKAREAGTGLGLSVTRAIVADQGGTIRVESELGKGTTFTVEWPIATRDRSARGAQTAA